MGKGAPMALSRSEVRMTYFKNYRRGKNAAFFIVLGGVFLGLGVLAIFFMEHGWAWAAGCFAFGGILLIFPPFVIFARYGMRGGAVHYAKYGVPRKKRASEISAAVICMFDEYRRWKGFVPVTFPTENGQAAVPAVVLLDAPVDEEELDLCDTRTNTRLTFRRQTITDMALDFGFLKDLWNSDFSGKVYISEYIYGLYRPAFDELFRGSERVSVYDRIPAKMKKFQK